jgi:hypothetical protein
VSALPPNYTSDISSNRRVYPSKRFTLLSTAWVPSHRVYLNSVHPGVGWVLGDQSPPLEVQLHQCYGTGCQHVPDLTDL